jgi:hypothetical protein
MQLTTWSRVLPSSAGRELRVMDLARAGNEMTGTGVQANPRSFFQDRSFYANMKLSDIRADEDTLYNVTLFEASRSMTLYQS